MSLKYVSQLFQPIITIPKNAKIKNTEITCRSQKLLLECGLIRPTSSGLFTILPLARRALDKLEKLIVTVLDDVGAQRVSFPALTSESLWEKTGRLEGGGAELMKVEDRHGKKFLLSPTHEEAVADLLADVGPLSYKQLPLLIYQIGNKYRDEFRPKHGLLRAREFAMMDAYGAHATPRCAHDTYARVTHAYSRLFQALQLPVHRVSASPGAMGGAHSHEWQARAAAGEDGLALCGRCGLAGPATGPAGTACTACTACGEQTEIVNSIEVPYDQSVYYYTLLFFNFFNVLTEVVQAHEAQCDLAAFTHAFEFLHQKKLTSHVSTCAGFLTMFFFTVGHTFILDTKYSEPLRAHFVPSSGPATPLVMSCYGIGVTRLLAACVEIFSTEKSLRWPRAIAPYTIMVIGPKEGSSEWSSHGWEQTVAVSRRLAKRGDVLLDDRHHLTIGKRLLMADRMGYPCIVVCGKSTLEQPPKYEVYSPSQEKLQLMTLEQLDQELKRTQNEDNILVENKY